MTTTPAAYPQHPRPLVLGARWAYLIFAGLFAVGIVLQVFFAGLGVLVDPGYFGWHTTFAHLLELLLIVLLVLGVVGRVGWQTFGISTLILVLFGTQYAFMYGFEGPLRALHVVNALALFWLALQLGRRAWQLTRITSVGSKADAPGARVPAGHLLVGVSAVLLGAVVLFGVIFDDRRGFISPEDLPSQSGAEVPVETPVETSAIGEQLYAANCAGCHGGDGEGGVGPALAGNEQLEDGAFVLERLLNGRGAMPAWEGVLSDEQIAAVGSFIRTGFGNDFGFITTNEVTAHD